MLEERRALLRKTTVGPDGVTGTISYRERENGLFNRSLSALFFGVIILCICIFSLSRRDEDATVIEGVTDAHRSVDSRPSFVAAGVVVERNGRYRLVSASNPNSLAVANYTRNASGSGWNNLVARVIPEKISDHSPKSYFTSMQALGFLEGYISCQEMQDFYRNFYSGLFDGADPCDETLNFLDDNYSWMKVEAERQYLTSEYWFTVKGVLSQLEGILAGVEEGCSISDTDRRRKERNDVTGLEYLSSLDRPALLNLLLVNANGDLYQISDKFNDFDGDSFSKPRDDDYHKKKNSSKSSKAKEWNRRLRARSSRRTGRREDHCSALIKVLPDNRDVIFGHSTWDDYQSLGPRTIKMYSLPVMRDRKRVVHLVGGAPMFAVYTLHFSSSPALLSSVDDFYLVHKTTDDGSAQSLAVMETTIDVYSTHLLDLIVPHTMLCWIRARVANQLANSGAEWAELFSRHHSGTYANQWMVLDLPLFIPGTPPRPGFLHVLEEVPGLVHYEDLTDMLTTQGGYWASYNQPYFEDISIISGNAAECARDPDACYALDPRAKIFRDMQSDVKNLDDLQILLGYNRFQVDPRSKGDPCNAIACRSDLDDSKDRYPFGSIDGKTSSVTLSKDAIPVMIARLGPTADDQAPFCWSAFDYKTSFSGRKVRADRTYSHLGQPECFNYHWQRFPPLLS